MFFFAVPLQVQIQINSIVLIRCFFLAESTHHLSLVLGAPFPFQETQKVFELVLVCNEEFNFLILDVSHICELLFVFLPCYA